MDEPGWEQQEECEQRRYEEEQEALRLDAEYHMWLDRLEAIRGTREPIPEPLATIPAGCD